MQPQAVLPMRFVTNGKQVGNGAEFGRGPMLIDDRPEGLFNQWRIDIVQPGRFQADFIPRYFVIC